MKIYFILFILTSIIYAGTYDENYDVLNKNIVKKNYNTLMHGDFEKIIRFKEITFIDNKISNDSKENIENISKEIIKLEKSNKHILISIIGHTNRTSDDLNEKKVDSTIYANKFLNLFSYSLTQEESSKLSNNYAHVVAEVLIQNGSKKESQIIEYRNGKDNLYTDEVKSAKLLSNRVMVAIYIIPEKIIDSDNDGIIDYNDKCPNTPKGITVDDKGCALDSDNDGILDHNDKCPNTLKGLIVNKYGCHIYKILRLNFRNNSSEIEEIYLKKVLDFSNFLLENKNYDVKIIGHTDSNSSTKYNELLSLRRANSVKDFLINKGIDSTYITTYGSGETKPIASNDTKEGRALNRRIEVVLKLKVNQK